MRNLTGGCQCCLCVLKAGVSAPRLLKIKGLKKLTVSPCCKVLRKATLCSILGPDLTETLLGSRRESPGVGLKPIIFRWRPTSAKNYQVAQYLAIDQDPMFPRESLVDYLRQELFHRYGNILAETIGRPPG